MPIRTSEGAYRVEYVDHPVGVRLVGPDGRQHRELSIGLTAIRDRHTGEAAVARRWINAFRNGLNAAERLRPGQAEAFVSGVRSCRDVQDRYLKAIGIRTNEGRGSDGSLWVKPEPADYGRVDDVLVAFAKMTAVLRIAVFDGVDPSKVDPDRSRVGAKRRSVEVKRDGSYRQDVDRRLRMGRDPTSAPRLDDPRVYDRWIVGLERTRAPAPFARIASLARFGGGRAFQCLGPTLFDYFVAGKEKRIPIPDKGGDHRRRPLALEPGEEENRRILAYVAGDRARVSGMTLAGIRRLARDPRRRDCLKLLPLFTEDGSSFIKYGRLYRVCRRAAEAMDLFIHDGAYDAKGVKRFVVFHLLRHAYVYARLEDIDRMPAHEGDAARRKLIAYMGWSNEGMLRWYSAHHRMSGSGEAAAEFNERMDRATAEEIEGPDAEAWDRGRANALAAFAGM